MACRYIFRQLLMTLFAVTVVSRAAAQSIKGSSSAYPYDVGGNVSSPVKIVLVVLIFSTFFMAFFSLYLRKCMEVSGSGARPLPIPDHRPVPKFPSGLDRSVVESFPLFLYSDVKVLKIGAGALECAVCISEFSDDENLRLLPKCRHVFHPGCIDAWLAFHTTCPVCRANLTPENIDVESDSEPNRESTQIDESVIEIGDEDDDVIEIVEERVVPKFPRSHSTGHSLVPPGENSERYTLRLPEGMQEHVALKRAKSCGVAGDGGRRGNWPPAFMEESESTGKSDRPESSSSAGIPV